MKKIVMFLVLALSLNASQAFAGAYSFECSNPSGTVKINQIDVTIRQWDVNSGEELRGSMLTKSLPSSIQNYPLDQMEKTIPVLSVEVVGKVTTIRKTNPKDECGHVAEETFFVAPVIIRDLKSKKVFLKDTIFCRDYAVGGHCT